MKKNGLVLLFVTLIFVITVIIAINNNKKNNFVADYEAIQVEFTTTSINRIPPSDEDFVRVLDYIPDMFIDLRYSTEKNFTGERIYSFSETWLRYGTVKKLKNVQEQLKKEGKALLLFDGFRPTKAQFRLWEICPNPIYVSNPNKGFSSHSRGNTIDLTWVYSDGTKAVMPSEYDDFTAMADRDYSDCSAEARKNALFLENTMIENGFVPYKGEWWHYTDKDAYPVEKNFTPIEVYDGIIHCDEYISLRKNPDLSSAVIMKISNNERVRVHAKHGKYYYVECLSGWGYVPSNLVKRVKE